MRPTTTASQQDHPIVQAGIAHLNCPDDSLWLRLRTIVSDAVHSDKLTSLAAVDLLEVLLEVFAPAHLPTPSVALRCSIGVSNALQLLALHIQQDRPDLSLRCLQLAKLFYFFEWPEWGEIYHLTDWPLTNAVRLTQAVTHLHTAQPAPSSVDSSSDDYLTGDSLCMVSYCSYPKNADGSGAGWGEYSWENKKRYAHVHGYRIYHYDTPFDSAEHAWHNKLLAILENVDHCEWTVWVDCDAFVMNFSTPLHQRLQSLPHHIHLAITEDSHMLNTAVMAFRQSDWSRNLLQQSLRLMSMPLPFSFKHSTWHEQAPILFLLLVPSLLHSLFQSTQTSLTSPKTDSAAATTHCTMSHCGTHHCCKSDEWRAASSTDAGPFWQDAGLALPTAAAALGSTGWSEEVINRLLTATPTETVGLQTFRPSDDRASPFVKRWRATEEVKRMVCAAQKSLSNSFNGERRTNSTATVDPSCKTLDDGSMRNVDRHSNQGGYDSRVLILAQRAMNSYPSEIVESALPLMEHAQYEHGDFLISFNGCESVVGPDRCRHMMRRYFRESMENHDRTFGCGDGAENRCYEEAR
eukprot:GHVS01103110.1.p1 GENE.GHVS01103110.1~~GHVS01103110.1.p1  ORF type:complete len:577 (+),score=61.84 GHVS01103110.1:477-2207(+)